MNTQATAQASLHKARLWMPERVVFTPAALDEPWGQQILSRVRSLNLPIEELPRNRLTGLRGETERETYSISKRTLAVVTAPPSSFKLSPIPLPQTGSFIWQKAAQPTVSTVIWQAACKGRP